MSLVVVDTDVASTLLRRRAPDTLARQRAGHTIAITLRKVRIVSRLRGPHAPRQLGNSGHEEFLDARRRLTGAPV